MSDRIYGEKEKERIRLDLFLDAYNYSIGQELKEVSSMPDESPDFICIRPTGELVGIELTGIMVRPDVAFELQILGRDSDLGVWETIEMILSSIKKKEEKRIKPHWKLPEATILVLEIMDTPAKALSKYLAGNNLQDDFIDHGFCEVWIANHEPVEAYNTVDLFCLYPEEYWGAYDNWNSWEKPYG